MVPDIEREDRRRIEVVHRQVEEPLDLRRVQVERQHPRDPGDGQQVRHQLGADRRARLRPPVLPRIAEVGHHRGDPVRRRPAQRVAHDQEFHQVVVRRVRRRLDDEHVLAADVLVDLDEDLRVVEPLDPGLDQLHRLAAVHRDPPGDRGGQRSIRVAGDQLGLEEGVHGGGPRAAGVARRLSSPPGLAKPRRPRLRIAARPSPHRLARIRRLTWESSTHASRHVVSLGNAAPGPRGRRRARSPTSTRAAFPILKRMSLRRLRARAGRPARAALARQRPRARLLRRAAARS